MTEQFYLDKPARKLFSVHFMDYFLLESDDSRKAMSFEADTADFIIQILQRIEAKDPAILSVPRLSSNEWAEALNLFSSLKSYHPEIESMPDKKRAGSSVLERDGGRGAFTRQQTQPRKVSV